MTPPRHDLDLAVAALVRRQHGAFADRQARALGMTTRMIDRRVKTKRWLVLDQGVYALPSHPSDWLRQVKAAELRFEEGAISGRTACVLFGLADLRPGGIEVNVPRNRGRGTSRLARVRHRDGIETTTVSGIRVVTVPQAVADLAGFGDAVLLERAIDDALVRGQVTIDALVAAQEQLRSKRLGGLAAFESIVGERLEDYVPPSNGLEASLYRLLDDPRFPPYVRQAPFPWRVSALERVDAFVPAWSRIIEGDGRAWHARYRDFERDKRRDHEVQAHGIEVTRFSHRQIVHDIEYARSVLLAIDSQARAA